MVRSIQDIQVKDRDKGIPRKAQAIVHKHPEVTKEVSSEQKISSSPRMKRKKVYIRKKFIILFATAIFFGAFFILTSMYASARIFVTPKEQSFTLASKEFMVSKDVAAINFEVMIVPDEVKNTVTLTESKEVSIKAHGEVTLYNSYTKTAQSIPAGTYLADEKGKAYKTDKKVSIPGFTTLSGKTVPGQVSVGVTAFLAGDSYNGSPTTFHVTSYKGTSKYEKIYGKAKTSFTGGAVGLVYVFDNAKVPASDPEKTEKLKQDLLEKVEVPKGYILYPNASIVSTQVDYPKYSETPEATVTTKSTISAVLLKQDDLSRALLKNLLPSATERDREEIEFTNLSDLAFVFTNKNQSITKDLNSFAFTLTGEPHALWHPDEESLRLNLSSLKKGAVSEILKGDPGIAHASVKIFPPWSRYLPSADKIQIKLVSK